MPPSPLTKRPWLLASLALLLIGAGAGFLAFRPGAGRQDGSARQRLQAFVANPRQKPDAAAFEAVMKEVLRGYRQIIVLFADEAGLKPEEAAHAARIGKAIYHENQDRLILLDDALTALVASGQGSRAAVLDDLLTWIESGSGLFDADRLAFKETLQALRKAVAEDQTLPAVKLHRRIMEDLSALGEIEAQYDREQRQVFGRFGERGIQVRRQRWEDYVAKLKATFSVEAILRDYGTIIPYPQVKGAAEDAREISGKGLPPRTLLLTFDDGPHGTYSEEISAILKQYGVPGVFFELGQNLGRIDAGGRPVLGRLAPVSQHLLASGHQLGNHSFSHAQLAKADAGALQTEIRQTEALLAAVRGDGARLFRFPYGASSPASLASLEAFHLRAMAWNIDSRDWADPVPSSIVDRVLREVDGEQRGIVLFHDINERTVKALPLILDRLVAEGYRFASWENGAFKIGDAVVPAGAKAVPTTGYRESWAVVIGIDDYPRWPRLQYAVRDAEALRRTLVERFAFREDHVLTLKNQEATRANILGLLHDKLGQLGLQRDDRVLVFFAGHGTTRKLSSGRDLGYIVPVDAGPENLATEAIPMTEIQNLAEAIPAKHVFFVMDSCYSGLGLTRGAGSQNFLKENARRIGRQMLTAGGADQMVADGGPNGHSIFTWTLLQGLDGKADLNGDGFITATELAAYLSPAVSSVSAQTPAFGSLPGSEGGEFVFELPAETEFLSPDTRQLESSALALNQKIAAHLEGRKPTAPATIKTLEGGETKLTPGKAIVLAPRQAAQRANDRGLQAYREKRYADAEAAFAEALKLRPDFALAANNLGYVYYKQDRFAEAARWFENAIRMDPSRAIAYLNLGDACFKGGELPKARKAFETYLELAPKGAGSAYARDRLQRF